MTKNKTYIIIMLGSAMVLTAVVLAILTRSNMANEAAIINLEKAINDMDFEETAYCLEEDAAENILYLKELHSYMGDDLKTAYLEEMKLSQEEAESLIYLQGTYLKKEKEECVVPCVRVCKNATGGISVDYEEKTLVNEDGYYYVKMGK